MTEQRAALVQYLATLGALVVVVLVLAVVRDAHVGEALAGMLGFAVSARPRGTSAPVVAAATLGLAGALAIGASGCASSTPTIGASGCAVARKVCSLVDAACGVATAGAESP